MPARKIVAEFPPLPPYSPPRERSTERVNRYLTGAVDRRDHERIVARARVEATLTALGWASGLMVGIVIVYKLFPIRFLICSTFC